MKRTVFHSGVMILDRPIRLIGDWLASLPKRPVVGAFTATATKAVENDIKTLLGLRSCECVCYGI